MVKRIALMLFVAITLLVVYWLVLFTNKDVALLIASLVYGLFSASVGVMVASTVLGDD